MNYLFLRTLTLALTFSLISDLSAQSNMKSAKTVLAGKTLTPGEFVDAAIKEMKGFSYEENIDTYFQTRLF